MWSETDSDKITAYKTPPRNTCMREDIKIAVVKNWHRTAKKVTLCYSEAKVYLETVYTCVSTLLLTVILFLIY